MRLLIKLSCPSNSIILLNYNYPLSAAIYKILKFGSEEFSSFLHDIGFQLNGKSYKLFTFALNLHQFKIQPGYFSLSSSSIDLLVSSPLIDTFIQNFVIGSFNESALEISQQGFKSVFHISQIESLPEPPFSENLKFILKSPLVISTVRNKGSNKSQYFFRYSDDINEIKRVFNSNLANKYKLVNNRSYSGVGVNLAWDYEYIKKRINSKKNLTRKITVKKSEDVSIDIIGNMLPFTLTGDPELMRIGYQCGFGEKNSMGFGLAEIV